MKNKNHTSRKPICFVSLLLSLLATACGGPKLFVVSGGELRGTLAPGSVEDWAFTDAVERVQLETRPDDPYSVHVYGVGSTEAFYVASQGWRMFVSSAGDARWVHHIAVDPRVRLRVGKTLYELEAIRIQDRAELERVRELFRNKYDGDAEKWGFWLGDGPPWVYRLDPRS